MRHVGGVVKRPFAAFQAGIQRAAWYYPRPQEASETREKHIRSAAWVHRMVAAINHKQRQVTAKSSEVASYSLPRPPSDTHLCEVTKRCTIGPSLRVMLYRAMSPQISGSSAEMGGSSAQNGRRVTRSYR